MNKELMTSEDVAIYFGITKNCLEIWRTKKLQPLKYVKIGRLVRYRREDVEAFLQENTKA